MDENGQNENETNQLERVREVVLKAHPDAVPEMIGGADVATLLGSVEPARAAFARLREQVQASSLPPAVPAGASSAGIDPAMLPSHELIRRGVERRRVRR